MQIRELVRSFSAPNRRQSAAGLQVFPANFLISPAVYFPCITRPKITISLTGVDWQFQICHVPSTAVHLEKISGCCNHSTRVCVARHKRPRSEHASKYDLLPKPSRNLKPWCREGGKAGRPHLELSKVQFRFCGLAAAITCHTTAVVMCLSSRNSGTGTTIDPMPKTRKAFCHKICTHRQRMSRRPTPSLP
jgi:hypothetical protein